MDYERHSKEIENLNKRMDGLTMSFVRLEELYSDKLRDQNKNFKTISDYQSTGKQLQLQKQESSETKRRIEYHRNCVPDLPP